MQKGDGANCRKVGTKKETPPERNARTGFLSSVIVIVDAVNKIEYITTPPKLTPSPKPFILLVDI